MAETVRNTDADWEGWDADAYVQQYLGGVLLADRMSARLTIGTFKEYEREYGIRTAAFPEGIDVGGGGVPRVPALIAPLVREKVWWTDYGEPQLRKAEEIIKAGRQGDLGDFEPHQTHMAQCDSAWNDAMWRACRLGAVAKRSIFDLPERGWPVSFTAYSAESLTEDPDEWEAATRTFFASADVLAGMWYMVGSTGYDSAGGEHPALPVDGAMVRQAVRGLLRPESIVSFFIPKEAAESGSAEQSVRPHGSKFSYEGFGGLMGIRLQ